MLNIYVTSPLKQSGKTFISTGIAATMQSLGYKTSVYKPFETNCIEKNGFKQSHDLTLVKTLDPYIGAHVSYLLKCDSEPLIAAEQENEIIDIELINNDYQKIISTSECTILDGDHSILSPVSAEVQNADLIRRLQIPVLIVTKPDENSVDTTLQTIYSAQEKGIIVRGVIINGIQDDDSGRVVSISRIIEEYSNVKILGLVSRLKERTLPEEIITSILNGIDIESVFDVKIEKLELC